MKECKSCKKELDDTSFEKNRLDCKKCIYAKKKERAAQRDVRREDAPHVDACNTCGIDFDRSKFTWRIDTKSWRGTCHSCTTPASASAKYKARLREEDEEAYKEAKKQYMREYRKTKLSK